MISIHQSQFLPWVPYFFKILKSDIFVVLDDVQFQKNGVQNRNMIKTPKGAEWLTVPVKSRFGAPINEVEVADINMYPRLLKTLDVNCKRSRFFRIVYNFIEDIFNSRPNYLHKLNMELLEEILRRIGAKSKIYHSSSMQIKKKKDDLVIEIIKTFNENEYLSGKGALSYMDLRKFKRAGIKVYTYDFKYAEYDQLWNKRVGFIPDLSIVDLLFNNLENTHGYILDNGSIRKII